MIAAAVVEEEMRHTTGLPEKYAMVLPEKAAASKEELGVRENQTIPGPATT